ncbi:MAG: glycosyltransferase family 4 protein [bacterium]|nr:glycosyltransferase family 4 protein [bacterium]
MKKLKVLLVSDPYYPYPSGISEYTFYLAKYLRKFGHSVIILTTHYPGEKDEEDLLRFGRVLMIPMNKSYATMSFGMEIPSKVKNLLFNNHFDIVHLNGPFPPSISFFALHYSKSVNIAAFLNAGFSFNSTGAGIARMLYKKYLNKISGRFALSETARMAMEPYFPGDYEIIPAGVDTEVFSKNANIRTDLKKTSLRILFLGRLDERKGIIVMIKAFKKLLTKKPDAKLVVAGKGPLDSEARNLAKSLSIEESVEFKGFIPFGEIPSYYRSADIYVSPALGGESFGIVLLEAMAVGAPVVASRIHGYSQVIKDNENGLLFETGDTDDLVSKILQLADDNNLREKCIKNGFLLAEKYSWENVASRIEKFYIEKLKEQE